MQIWLEGTCAENVHGLPRMEHQVAASKSDLSLYSRESGKWLSWTKLG